MNKNNNVMFGIILLVISVLALLHTFIDISYGAFSVLFLGVAFLVLYRTKRKSWALIVGMYLIYFGLGNILESFGFRLPVSIFTGCSFFIVPGVIFMLLFFDKNKTDLLTPASFLLWFGMYVLVVEFKAADFIGIAKSNLFILFMGFAMLTIFLLGRSFVSLMYLYAGGVFVAYSGIKLLASVVFDSGSGSYPPLTVISSVVLIVVSLFIIFSNKRRH